MSRRAVLLGVVAMLGCKEQRQASATCAAGSATSGSAVAAASVPAGPVKRSGPADALVAKAEQLLVASVALDERRPLLDAPYDREPVRRAFYEACRAGDVRSCWMVREVENRNPKAKPQLYEQDAVARVMDHCRGGDRLSCYALRDDDFHDIDVLPGHYARNVECRLSDGACDLDGLARECRAGSGPSCVLLLQRRGGPDRASILADARRFTSEACRAGIMRDCELIPELFPADADRAERIVAADLDCTIGMASCVDLGKLYLSTDPAKAQEALERACQFVGAWSDPALQCEDLWRGYTAKPPVLREPTPGRAAQLRDWLCKTEGACW